VPRPHDIGVVLQERHSALSFRDQCALRTSPYSLLIAAIALSFIFLTGVGERWYWHVERGRRVPERGTMVPRCTTWSTQTRVSIARSFS
jgi:hypothetical protein